MSEVVAFDIGGANIKAADGCGWGVSRPFPLWKQPELLAAALDELLTLVPSAARLVATMTGELADCFETKADGVRTIVEALEHVARGRLVELFAVDGSWQSPEQAKREPLRVAASNWNALARFAARWIPESGVLIDCGSTTCDIIPIMNGVPIARGTNDPERLVERELVYSGVERTALMGLVSHLPWRGAWCPVARELFATTWDAYLVRGDLPEEPESTHTADGRPATRQHALDRLARMICADRTLFTLDDARQAADHIHAAQLAEIVAAVRVVVARWPVEPTTVVVSGQGEFLARRAVEQVLPHATIISLSEQLGPTLSRIAPAHALACLARERT